MKAAHIRENGEIQNVEEHCKNTAAYAYENGKSVGLEHTMKLAGLLHDMGKNTRIFDEYIRSAHSGKATAARGTINHSSAGAKYLTESKGISDPITLRLIGYSIIAHHGLTDCLTYEGENKYAARINPDKEIYYEEAKKNSEDFLNKSDIKELFSSAENEVKNYLSKIKNISQSMNGAAKGGIEKFFLLGCLQRLMLSMLTDADRRDTAEFMSGKKQAVMTDTECRVFFERCLAKLKEHLNVLDCSSKINVLRGEMSEQCEKFAENHTEGIYKLPIPTGGGKTYASMRYALKNAILTGKRHIIYIAPYLSVLEQNAADIKNVFEDNENILEHHSNVFFEKDDDELQRYEILSDSWDSPIIFTTMVRFLDVLFGGKISDVRRMNSLKNTVIIIDEAQTIPVKYINLFNTMLNFLGETCHSAIVMCTATQPIFEKTKRPLLYAADSNMIPDIDNYNNVFKRVEMIPDYANKVYHTEELSEFISDITENNCLVILNTKSAVRKLYDYLKETAADDFEDFEIIQLTTYMCARHRLDIIAELKKKLKRKEKIICISTQLIEAGVDISFQTVVRSLAGLDSIAQAAGRCNRNGESSSFGKTYIIRYAEENVARLTDIKKAQESMEIILYQNSSDLLMPQSIEKYYQQYFFDRQNEMDCSLPKIHSKMTLYSLLSDNRVGRDEYKKMHKTAYGNPFSQAFKTAGTIFQPIDNGNTIGIIVYYDDAKEIIEKLHQTDNFEEQRRLLRQLQRYTVNLNQNSSAYKSLAEINAFDMSLFDGQILILSESYYDEKIGVTSELSDMIF